MSGEEIVPVLFQIPKEDGSVTFQHGFIKRPVAAQTGPTVTTLIPVPTAPSTSTLQILPSSTGPPSKPTTSTSGKSRPTTLASKSARSDKKTSKEPLPLLPKPMSYGTNSNNTPTVSEPIQVATKFLLPVSSIQPILVAEPSMVQQGSTLAAYEGHGQSPSCSTWNFAQQPQSSQAYQQVYTTTSTSYETQMTQPTSTHTQVKVSTSDEKPVIVSMNQGYSPMKPPATNLLHGTTGQNSVTKRKSNNRNSFDSPSPSQVVPQMNSDPYDHHSIASTPSSGSYLPPINSIAPSSNGSLMSTHSPEGSSGDSSHTNNGYHPQNPPIQNFIASSTMASSSSSSSGSNSGHGSNHPSTSSSSTAVDAMDDLNSIEMTQLISHAGSINTEQYLAVNSVMPSGYQESQEHHQNSVNPGSMRGYQPTMSQNMMQTQPGPSPRPYMSNTTTQGSHGQHVMIPQQSLPLYSQGPSYPVHQQNTYHQHSSSTVYPSSSTWVDPNQHQPQQQVHHPPYRVGYGHQPASHASLMSSSTPDSGIQSIDGSPPSTNAFTPPMMVSPYAAQGHIYEPTTTTLNAGNRNTLLQPAPSSVTTQNQDQDDDVCDFSDMPTLVPIDQMSHDDDSYADGPPIIAPSSNSSMKKYDTGSTEKNLPKRNSLEAITPVPDEPMVIGTPQKDEKIMPIEGKDGLIVIPPTISSDPKELAKHLLSNLDPSVLKEIAGSLLHGQSVTIQNTSNGPNSSNVTILQPSDQPSTSSSTEDATSKASFLPQDPVHPTPSTSQASIFTSDMSIDVDPPPTSTPHQPTPDPSPSKPQDTEGESEIDQETLDRIAQYRRQAKTKLQNRLQNVMSNLETKFEQVHLNLGKSVALPLPWQHMDWKRITERLAKRSWVKPEKPSGGVGSGISKKHKKLEEHRRKRKSDEYDVEMTTKKREKHQENGEKSEKLKKKEKKLKKVEESMELAPKLSPPSLKITIVRRDSEISIKSRDQSESREPTPKKEDKPRSRSRSIKEEYTKIRTNIFINSPMRQSDPEPCACNTTDPCTSSCPHKQAKVECTPLICRLHLKCQNRQLQNNAAVTQLRTFKTGNKGLGVRSDVEISSGQYICEYVGEVIHRAAYEERMEKRKSDMPRFGIELTTGFVIDATKKGNISRFMNHSCAPNCEMQKWVVNGQYRLAIFAKTKIDPGQELTYDYASVPHAGVNKPAQTCHCGSEKCRGTIPSTAKPISRKKPEKLSPGQVELLKSRRVFLHRNLKKWTRRDKNRDLKPIPGCELSEVLVKLFENFTSFCTKKEKFCPKRTTQLRQAIRHIFRLASVKNSISTQDSFLLERFDSTIKAHIHLYSKIFDRRRSEAIRGHYLHLKRQTDLTKFASRLSKDSIANFMEEKQKIHSSPTKKEKKLVSREADLSYMDSPHLVGSYDPDKESNLTNSENEERDCVRCICGIMEDDGEEVQCDKCKFWLHIDCVNRQGNLDEDFICPFCTKKLKSTPSVDIILTPQPEMKFQGCTYYRTLVNQRGIQVRVNEAVYVERLINDKHKLILKKLHEECARPLPGRKKDKDDKDPKKSLKNAAEKEELDLPKLDLTKQFHRKDLRTFRVERLFVGPNGQRFVFGCYYARPHETFCDPSRMFFKNELFWTPLFDTLPLDAVVGRCLILDPSEWVRGRPKSPKYREEDVFICEYQIDKNQRSFEKIKPQNKYSINTDRYVFDEFEEKLTLKRNFTPFVLPSHHQKVEKKDRKEAKDLVESLVKKTNAEFLNHLCANLPLNPSSASTSSSGHT